MLMLARADTAPPWKRAELAVAGMFGGVLFTSLEPSNRRFIHGGGIPADRGVDVVTAECGLYQVKLYKDNSDVGHDVVARLNNIAEACNRHGGEITRRAIAVKRGKPVRRDIPGIDVVDVLEYTDNDIEIATISAKLGLACINNKPTMCADLACAYEKLHDDVVRTLIGLHEGGKNVLCAELPTGAGKSYILAHLCRHYATAEPLWGSEGEPKEILAIIVEPRIEIVHQIAKLYNKILEGFTVHEVTEGRRWPNLTAGKKNIVVMTGQSAGQVPANTVATMVAYDEAHTHHGRDAIEAAVARDVTFMFSATISGAVDYRLPYRDAVSRGIICDSRFVFIVFPRPPEYEDYVRFLVENPEYMSVMACFRRKKQAVAFSNAYNRVDAGMSNTYITSITDDTGCIVRPDDNRRQLGDFQDGKYRVMCVVTKTEMGVDIHRCDTVLFVEPWKSIDRLRQLSGRASRHHPTKCGLYTILFGVGPDAAREKELVDRVVDKLYEEVGEQCPQTAAELIDKVDFAPGIHYQMPRDEFEALSAIRVSVYNSFGQHLPDEYQRIRAQFDRDRRELVGRDIRTYEGFQRLRASRPELMLPENPPVTYAVLYGEKPFPWHEYLDYEIPTTLAEMKQALAEVITRDSMSRSPVPVGGLKRLAMIVYDSLAKKYPELPRDPTVMFPGSSYLELFDGI